VPTRDGYANGVPSWVDLSTTDVEKAKTFYGELFGWEWVGNEMPGFGTYWMATLKGQLVAGLSGQPPEMAAQHVPSMWNTYVNVDSVDQTVAKAMAAGGQLAMPAADIPDAGRMAFLIDPSGATFGLWQPSGHKGAGLVNEHGALIWNEVLAPDTARIVEFYRKVFGWEPSAQTMEGMGEYTMFNLDGSPVGGTMAAPTAEIPPHWRIWFGSSDPVETAAKAAELGATVVISPTDSPMGKVASLLDPTGAGFSVITAAAAG